MNTGLAYAQQAETSYSIQSQPVPKAQISEIKHEKSNLKDLDIEELR